MVFPLKSLLGFKAFRGTAQGKRGMGGLMEDGWVRIEGGGLRIEDGVAG
jgi:hypothetical protein